MWLMSSSFICNLWCVWLSASPHTPRVSQTNALTRLEIQLQKHSLKRTHTHTYTSVTTVWNIQQQTVKDLVSSSLKKTVKKHRYSVISWFSTNPMRNPNSPKVICYEWENNSLKTGHKHIALFWFQVQSFHNRPGHCGSKQLFTKTRGNSVFLVHFVVSDQASLLHFLLDRL